MPSHAQKKPAQKKPAAPTGQFVAPKRGKARMLSREDSNVKKKTAAVPYTRHGSKPPRAGRIAWALNLFSIFVMTNLDLTKQLVKDGVLENLEDQVCSLCNEGSLHLQSLADRDPIWRCSYWDCKAQSDVKRNHLVLA
jgi:hypothetical protein